MSIVASEIKIFAATGAPEDDSTLAGGAIDTSTRMIFDDYVLANVPGTSGDGTLRYYSTNDGDSGKSIIAYGRTTNGSLIQETGVLGNSGILVTGTQIFERILKVVVPAFHLYDILVQDSTGNTILTMEGGIGTVRRPFYNVSASPTEVKTYYDKCFVKNTNATLSLLNASFIESADPSTYVAFSLSDEINDSDTFTNRLTQPTATGTPFNSSTKSLLSAVGVSDLAPGSGVSLYLSLTLPSGAATSKTYWTVSVSGETI